ncbi:MAG TPA: prepilin-type N-terminal cleavage/methylation domain-containing protein [Candidatus Acidoferrales bacterium]|nr:prepilin-type N-terminal cleavage/methylation domain-containing protein [Candidatus Acidoferrales bacterium]
MRKAVLYNLNRPSQAAYSLIEVVISIAILAMVMSGLVYGYVEANWSALWSSMSLSAQSYASEGAEQARATDWRPRDYPAASGYGTMDEWPSGTTQTLTNYMDIPGDNGSGQTFRVTNIVSVTTATVNPPLRQIRSDCIWKFPRENKYYTNTVILLRTSDQ